MDSFWFFLLMLKQFLEVHGGLSKRQSVVFKEFQTSLGVFCKHANAANV